MRRIRSVTLIFLILLLLLSGCDSAGTAETTAPPETTVPVETTLPPETTAPPETTMPPEAEPTEPIITAEEVYPRYAMLKEGGFEHCHGTFCYGEDGELDWEGYLLFRYEGNEHTVRVPGTSIEFTLPDEWIDQVSVFYGDYDLEFGITLVSNRMIEAYREYVLSVYPNADPDLLNDMYRDSMLKVRIIPWARYPDQDPKSPDEGIYLGQDENYYYWAVLPEDEYFKHNREMARKDLIESIGQEAYDALVGDLIIPDYDMVQEIIQIVP